MSIDVDALAQIIREVDGNHSLGAAALAEAIVDRLLPVEAQGVGGIDQRARELLAEQYQSSQGAKQILSGPWTLEQDRAIRAIAAALSAQPRQDDRCICEGVGWSNPQDHLPNCPHTAEVSTSSQPQPASAPVGVEAIIRDLRGLLEEMDPPRKPATGGRKMDADQLRHTLRDLEALAQQPAAAEKTLSDALAYVGQRADGDLPTLAERCALWMRESKSLIDYRRHPPRPKGVATQQPAAVDGPYRTMDDVVTVNGMALADVVKLGERYAAKIEKLGMPRAAQVFEALVMIGRHALAQPQGEG